MTTRNRALRGEDLREFEGRVRKWTREWQPANKKTLKFLKWIPTEERDKASSGKRHPHLEPVPTPTGKPLPPLFMRPRITAAPISPAFPAAEPAKFKLKLTTAATKQGG